MKISVLLPTRNRLDLLKYAVETVLRQDYEDWEIIISDNNSEQDIGHYVQSLGDNRIKYYRTDRLVPVTENWNNALYRSEGDYIIMLGDDDCLMKGFFRTVKDLAVEYDSPDFIYSRVFLYAYPGVLPDFPDGFLQTNGCAQFFGRNTEPFLLETNEARPLVLQSMNFRLSFDYNMQYSVVRRAFIDRLGRGPFFQSPYPDYYASNVLFLKADRILVCPLPLVTIGITPKSFGFYYYNDKEEQGTEFLKNLSDPAMVETLRNVFLPGTNMNDSWLVAMETIKGNYGHESGLRVNYRRYRTIQFLHAYQRCAQGGKEDRARLDEVWQRLTSWEKISYRTRVRLLSLGQRYLKGQVLEPMRRLMGMESPYPEFSPYRCPRRFENILEVFEQIEPAYGLTFAFRQ